MQLWAFLRPQKMKPPSGGFFVSGPPCAGFFISEVLSGIAMNSTPSMRPSVDYFDLALYVLTSLAALAAAWGAAALVWAKAIRTYKPVTPKPTARRKK